MAQVFYVKGATSLPALVTTNELVIGEGSATITGSINLSGIDGLGSTNVLPQFTGVIGSGASPFKASHDVGAAVFNYAAGGGACYYSPDGNSVNTCTTLNINSAGRFYLVTTGTVTTCGVVKGYLSVAEEVIVTTLWVGGGEVVQGYNATANTLLTVEGGTLTTGRTATTANIGSGASVIFRDEQSQANRIACTTMNVAGRVKWSGGNIGTVNLIGNESFLDLSDAPNALTITALNGSANSLRRSVLASRHATVTITTTTSYGGTYAALDGGLGL